MRRLPWLIGLLLLLAGSGWGVASWLAKRQLREELAIAARDMDAGRFGSARQRLARLAQSWPAQGEVNYRLGVCEREAGRFDAALAAWARVPAGSPFAAKAAVARGTELINTGRYSPAESVLEAALPAAGPDAIDVLRALIRLYRFEGRTDDVRRLTRRSWPLSDDPAGVLKELWLSDTSPIPAEALGLALSKADPQDDRVWLGRANLARLTGRFDEAAKWLDACRKRRPDDPVVWRSALDLARAQGDPAEAWEAMQHLPASSLTGAERLDLRAWLVAARGDAEAERIALGDLFVADPGRIPAVERLATLSAAAGRPDDARDLNRLKAQMDDAMDRYRKLILDGGNLADRAAEFASLARTLGRPFDARAWAILRDRRATARGPVGVDPAEAPEASPEGTLASRLAAVRPPADAKRAAPSAAPVNADLRFDDDAEAAGLRFTYDTGRTLLRQLPETMSGGVAVLDVDGDGWLDVFCPQGGPLTIGPGQERPGDRLFRNKGDGTFEDATETSGMSALPRAYTLGAAVGDVDNDGHPDLFLSRLTSYALLRNKGDGTFEDATERFGLDGPRDNPTSAAFADLDNDGDLDLYVCHYMIWDPDHPTLCENEKGEYFYCDPSRVARAADHLFRNDGGKFVDVTDEAGITDPNGRGLGVVAADVDGDGLVDLYVANDGTANYLFRNLGGFRFEEVAHPAGVAGNAEGGYQASMGVACGDLDGDGRPELLVTNFYGEASTLYANLGRGFFRDATAPSGLGVASRYLLGFGTAFLDADNDGDLDLATTYGHVNDNRPFYPYAMPSQLLLGDGRGRLSDATGRAGAAWSAPRVGRGLAPVDLDNDGNWDVLILPQDDPLVYLHNRSRVGRSIAFRLIGTRSNRDGVGASLTLVSGGRKQFRQRFGGGSYQSAGDPRIHFGLGPNEAVDSLEVRWPSGKVDRLMDLKAGVIYTLREGESAPSDAVPYATTRD